MPTIHSLLVALTYPLGLSAALLLLAMLALGFRQRRSARALAAVAVCWSVVWSVPAVSDWLRQSLADQHPVVPEAALPKADAIVVLGGGAYEWTVRTSVNPDDLINSRLAAGARAWRAGRAPTVILSGGRGPRGHTEAQNMARAMTRFGIPASALLLEQRSRDTRDNAAFTAVLAREHGMKRVLLVTSSLHMPRASLLFRQAGVDVVAVSVPEPGSGSGRLGWGQWLPSRSALWRSGRALKEYAGLLDVRLQDPVGRMGRRPAG